eukprot:TRINITY_DN72789_c0_g1_i1.p1 TRINITY_DN72789_c0_g1~~TRINITY_DN72789_c0_g1_i1.p1  ORF type:complete len:457 (+),score=64.12 TRINITY_DN72789_c0_g1_i1:101-1372(+)
MAPMPRPFVLLCRVFLAALLVVFAPASRVTKVANKAQLAVTSASSLAANSGGLLNASRGIQLPDDYCPGKSRDYYNAERKLGGGSFGSVWLISEKQDPKVAGGTQKVAVMKMVLKAKFNKLEIEPMRLALPFNLPINNIFVSPASVELVLPFFESGSFQHLDKPQEKRPLSVEEAAMIARGLYHLHDAGFIHRDFKGDNIMFSADKDLVTLIDYGLVTRWSPDAFPRDASPIGNRLYMAPERMMVNRRYGPETDWFAFGLLLYHAHAGERLYTTSGVTGRGLRDKLSGSRVRAHLAKMLPGQEALQDLLALCLSQTASGRQLYSESSDGSDLPFAKGYPSVAQHPVLQHAYFRGVDWQRLRSRWPQYKAGICNFRSPAPAGSGDGDVTAEQCSKKGERWDQPCPCERGDAKSKCCCLKPYDRP